MIPVKVKEIAFDAAMNPVLLLADEKDNRMLPIWIGPFEAQAIALALEGASLGRPLTHDLLKTICDRTGAKVASVIISDVRDGTYYAELHLQVNNQEIVIDSRPSDAVALALRTVTPIYITEKVADYALTPEELYSQEASEETRIRRLSEERKLH
ncbi:bifunctional nuclease family protein [Thermodesulfitimonas autotrophica]|uniref:bifunctional nuclease family protein n=1 Tax=Thermodesulfitimonas autotrophica TaxID=1894989 RepID=UPI002FE0C29C